MNLPRHALILLLACTGCASRPAAQADVPPDAFSARWSVSSNAIFLSSTLPQDIVYQAKSSIASQGVAFCDAARFSLRKIEPAIANAGASGPDEMWTTDMCGERKWLVPLTGQAQPVPR